MSLNCEEIEIILDELDLEGSFIQQIVQPGFDSLALYTYKEGRSKTVFISLANGACRINETRKKVPKNEKPLRFMEFMKSRIKGCRIDSCAQIGKERIIKFELSHHIEDDSDDDSSQRSLKEHFFMFVRLWSGSANIIITDENLKILDVFYRRPNKGEIGGNLFVLPEIREQSKVFEARTFDEICDFSESCADGDTIHNEFGADKHGELSYNEKVELYYSENAESLSRKALLEQAERYFSEHRTKIQGALSKLEDKRASFLKSDELKHFGDLILAYGYQIDGESEWLECEDYETGENVRIRIDPKKSVQENASKYYEQYKKSVSGLEELEYDIQKLKKELLDLESSYEAVQNEPNPIRMQQLLRKQTRPKQQIEKKRPGVSYFINGWTIFVGRDANENDELLRHHVKGQDMWMHTRDFAGGYVFIKNRPGKTIPLDILLNAGNLAVYHSKARKANQADLYYTQVKYLRRAKNGPKGLVLPTHEKNITIKIDNERLKLMEASQIEK